MNGRNVDKKNNENKLFTNDMKVLKSSHDFIGSRELMYDLGTKQI